MRTEERTPTQSRAEAARQGPGGLDYFFKYFFTVNKWTTETSFISIMKWSIVILSTRAVYFVIQLLEWTRKRNPKGSNTVQHCAQWRLVYTSDINTSTSFIKRGRYSTSINTNTAESMHSFFLFSPVINAFKEQVEEKQTSSLYFSCFCP